jgi:hypothetical protein
VVESKRNLKIEDNSGTDDDVEFGDILESGSRPSELSYNPLGPWRVGSHQHDPWVALVSVVGASSEMLSNLPWVDDWSRNVYFPADLRPRPSASRRSLFPTIMHHSTSPLLSSKHNVLTTV